MRKLKYNTKQVWTDETVHTIVQVHTIVEKIAGVNSPLIPLEVTFRVDKSFLLSHTKDFSGNKATFM